MTTSTRVTAIGALAVVTFDALASVASRITGISYVWATLGSWMLYASCGYAAARIGSRAAISTAALTGLVLGLTDASLGWAVSWAIGPGRVAGGLGAGRWLSTLAFVAAAGAGIAACGGSAARFLRR